MIALAVALHVLADAAGIAAPGLTWRTIRTQCCDVHYHVEVEGPARRVAAMADPVVDAIDELIHARPTDRVQIVVADVTDAHNGFTLTVPYDHLELRAIQPSSDEALAASDDYLRLLLVHEMTHVAHLDDVSGLPAVVNVVLGKWWPPNLIQPLFVVEGLATWAETTIASRGRATTAAHRGELRLAALHGDLWSFDDLSNPSRRGPGGGAPYLYGAAFLSWLVERHGVEMIRRQIDHYGGGAIPYAVQRSFAQAAGVDLRAEYALFLDDVRAEAFAYRDAVVARGGPTRARRLTRVGGRVAGPRFAKDGALVVGLDPQHGPPGVYALDGLPAARPVLRPVVRTNEAADVAVLDDGALLVAQTETWRSYSSFHDLFVVDADRVQRRATRGLRARAPDPLPDGRVVVERRSGAESAIAVVDPATGRSVDLVRSVDGTQHGGPRASPDGARVVWTRMVHGRGRDLVELDRATGALRALTDDEADDVDPVYTRDGRAVLFASDRDGAYGIHRVDLADLSITRVVDTLGAARRPEPTPDGRAVVYVDETLDGQDLFVADLPRDPAPSTPSAPLRAVEADAPPPDVAAAEAYAPWATLVPRNWLPTLASDARGGPAVGAVVEAEDAIGSHRYAVQASWGFAIMRPRASATWRWKDLWTPLVLNGEWRTDVVNTLRLRDGEPEPQQDTVLRAGVSTSIPLRTRRHQHSFGFGYSREAHFVETPFSSRPDERPPVFPPSANVGWAQADWSYTTSERGLDAVSTEHGFGASARLRLANALTLSEQELAEFSLDARVFRPVPGLTNHVVALYGAGAVAFGDRLRRANWFLGGFAERDITQDIVRGYRSGGGFLRGFPTSFDVGDAYLLGTLEYRAPLLEIERGIETLPIALDRVWGAVFADVGDAFDGLPNPAAFHAGVGAELRVELALGYYGAFSARAGVARGLTPGGLWSPYLVMGIPF